MHAIQTSGNCIRNITADPYAGATADEIDDPRVWAEAIRQWSTFHPEFSFLPRKFKIAVTATPQGPGGDQGPRHRPAPAPRRRRRAGLRGAWSAAGWAARPTSARRSASTCRRAHLLLVPAGDPAGLQPPRPARQHPNKARIKILVASLGAEEFARQVEAEWEKIDKAAGRPAGHRAGPHPRRLRAARLRDPAGDVGGVRGGQGRRPGLRPLRPQQRARRTRSPATPSSTSR